MQHVCLCCVRGCVCRLKRGRELYIEAGLLVPLLVLVLCCSSPLLVVSCVNNTYQGAGGLCPLVPPRPPYGPGDQALWCWAS
jgi:hypothetical protein